MNSRCGETKNRTERGLFALPVASTTFASSPTLAKHGKTTEESLHSPVSLHTIHLWDHDGTEDPKAQRRLLGSGSRLGAPADDSGEDGPTLRVP